MDAREYLSRQGVSLDRDPDKPNTLEEKAWERARGAGQQRPKSGTPHDWEEWERYHGDLAGEAGTLEQKIDKDAHREAEDRDKRQKDKKPDTHHTPAEVKTSDETVSYFDPTNANSAEPSSADSLSGETLPSLPDMPGSLKVAYTALALLLPPLAVGLAGGNARRVGITCVLTALLWLPGVIYAVRWLLSRKP
ncbi:YqaE/Pmp3 family membrane protein [Vreelandella aquamarina]